MMRSLFAGISGLRNFQTKMDIIGNNIANVNTVGFKGSRITFSEAMSQTLSGEIAPTDTIGGVNAIQVGLGMRTLGIDTNFTQGSLEATGVNTDLAVQGDGFFIVTDGDQQYYTRAGTFHIDANGSLVQNGIGYKVMGYMAAQGGDALNRQSLQAIQIPLGKQSEGKATSDVTLRGNLDMNMTDSRATLIDAGTTGIVSASGIAVNGQGGRHEIVIEGSHNATRSSGAGDVGGLQLNQTLEELGVTDANFTITVDGEREFQITGLTTSSTVDDVLRAINSQASGVTAAFDPDNGSVVITRDYYGNGAAYKVELNDPEGIGNEGLVHNLFNAGGSLLINNGQDSDLQVIDNFTPSWQAAPIRMNLDTVRDERTGLDIGIRDFGGGGITISAPVGLALGTAIVETAETTHSTSIFVFDSLGNTHNLTINLTRTNQTGVWRWTAELPEGTEALSGNAGMIRFFDDGSLDSFTYDDNATNLSFNPGNGAQIVSLELQVGASGSLDGMTQSAAATSALATSQDGHGMGQLQGIFIDGNGRIYGNFTNGVSEIMAQVLLSNFTNPQGLEKVGENLYMETTTSGQPNFAEAPSLGSQINSGYLEMSNVDLTKEFTDMILAQRAFQAAARVITTSDGLLEEVIRLKLR